jgi:hypothetical protein
VPCGQLKKRTQTVTILLQDICIYFTAQVKVFFITCPQKSTVTLPDCYTIICSAFSGDEGDYNRNLTSNIQLKLRSENKKNLTQCPLFTTMTVTIIFNGNFKNYAPYKVK